MSNENGKMSGKVAFVTGAGAGIGRAAALAFAAEGAAVAVADRSEENVRETARVIVDAGRRAVALRCDVSQGQDIKTFGRLDYAFNNAGIEQPVVPLTRTVRPDIRGRPARPFLCMKHQIPLM
jgi:NAD(P)-dependent dehydrogenase (short-subunit alcohol dehydrogenase family)